jgi:hypothetical protein
VNAGTSVGVAFAFRPTDAKLQLGQALFVGGEGCDTQFIELRGLGPGSLIADEATLDFGRVPLHESRTRTVTLHNTRRVPLDVEVVVTSPAVHAAPLMHVPALGLAQLELVASPTQVSVLDGSVLLRAQDAAGVTRDSLAIGILGRGGSPTLRLLSNTVSFGYVPFGRTVQRNVTVVNDGPIDAELGPLLVLTDPAAPQELSVAVLGDGTLAPGAAVDVAVRLTPSMPAGARAWTVLITGEDEAQTRRVDVTANAAAISPCAQTLSSNPASVHVPNAAFPFTVTFSFDNPTDGACLVENLQLNPTWWTLDGGPQLLVPAHGSRSVTLTASGPASGFLFHSTWGWAVEAVPITLGP